MIVDRIRTYSAHIVTSIRDCIAPPRCNGCAVLLMQRALLCSECRAAIIPVISTTVSLTRKYEMRVFAAGAYEAPLRKLVLAKHGSYRQAGVVLGELMWHLTPLATHPIDYIIPIPLHWTRKLYRGFNQTEEMANELARLSGKPVAHALQRVKRTQLQARLSATNRALNVADAFALADANLDQYRGKHLLLVDDLMTTGATLSAAGRVLLKLKPASLVCVVAARAI